MLSSPAIHLSGDEPTGLRALVEMEPREILGRFDSERDLQMRHHEALRVLRVLRTHESEDLAVRVGTAWANLHHAELSEMLRDGLAWIEEARPLVARLEAEEEASADPFAAYVLARWHGTAGRIRFRCGDVDTARVELTAAAKRCTRKELWFCRPDILSDLLRVQVAATGGTETEEARRKAVRRFSTLRVVMNQIASRRGIDLGAVVFLASDLARYLSTGGTGPLGGSREQIAEIIGSCDPREALRRCEMLRGLVNVHLSRAVLLAPDANRGWAGDLERARELGWWCARASYGVGDRYRLAQALEHIASLGS